MAIPTFNDIKDLLSKGMTLEAQEKIIELREAVINLEDDLHETKLKLKECEEKLAIKESLQFDNSVYWTNMGTAEQDGPFCPSCQDDRGKLVRVHIWQVHGWPDAWRCMTCESNFPKIA